MLRTETVSLLDEYRRKQYKEIQKQLDETNIRILSAMLKYGPRNLLEVSRRIGMPFTSVYHRISKIEAKSGEVAFLVPSVSKLGIMRVVVLAAASPGREDEVTHALKAPNIWRSIGFCEGTFTHISVQLVPVKFLREFRSYIQRLVDMGLMTTFSIIYTGDYVGNFPDFGAYNPGDSTWKFDWEGWLALLGDNSKSTSLNDPDDYTLGCEKKDLLVIGKLELDARRKFADIAQAVGMTPQSVKDHYQKLVTLGVAREFQFRVLPFAIGVSAYHEIMLEFNSKEDLDKFFSIVPKLFFVVGVAKILRRNAMMVQTWMLESQLQKMFSFFSHMARAGFLKSYSAVRMALETRETHTITDELFDDERGWTVDFEKCLSELSQAAKVEVSS